MSNSKDPPVKESPLAGKPVTPAMLVDVPGLVTAYYTGVPDNLEAEQRVAFGSSGHRFAVEDALDGTPLFKGLVREATCDRRVCAIAYMGHRTK